jgi:hypothetical protein
LTKSAEKVTLSSPEAMPSRLRFGPMAQPWGQQNTGHTASWNPESSRFHIFSNLFHIVLLVTVDFPDDVGWFACLSLRAINAVTAGPGAKNLFLDLHKRGVFLSSTSLAKDHQNFTVFKWCFFNDGYIHPICPG